MTTVENQPHASTAPDDIYDPDDVGFRDSPPFEPIKPNLQPSQSPPPAVPLPQVSPEPSPGPGRKGSNRGKNRPSQGDAVLVSFMDGGKRPEIARTAGNEPLASDDDMSDDSMKGTEVHVEKDSSRQEVDLTALAAGALRAHEAHAAQGNSQPTQAPTTTESNAPILDTPPVESHAMEDIKTAIPSIVASHARDSHSQTSPEAVVKIESKASPPPPLGELPPIQQLSPKSGHVSGNSNGPITLPSISDQLGDLSHLSQAAAPGDPSFSQSPPARPPPRFSTVPGQGSPPLSPNDAFRRELPSPGRGTVGATAHYYYNNNNNNSHRRPSQTEGPPYTSAGDYSSSNTETPSTDQSGSTPATAIDRMSIDGITNPQIGGFQCTYQGCTAQPFQTQYLLNSHANVHSSNRPHYCTVKGCPRSEGGKGFKRKNEMIRHGLVHDSPGYVCPFCPDREHKYPRPDNLQRHVRVHHVDKDKDDAQLREVLSQRPEGPSRGRRRRGGTS